MGGVIHLLPKFNSLLANYDKIVLATYLNEKYLHRFLALYNSSIKHIPNVEFYVLALDRTVEKIVTGRPHITTVVTDGVLPKELLRARDGLSVSEAIWILTPAWCQWVLNREERFSYIDADCMFFSSPSELYKELYGNGIAITPHRFAPEDKHWENASGKYNVGLVYFENGKPAFDLLREWYDMCVKKKSFCGDQGAWDFLSTKHKIHPIDLISVGVAPWNAKQYKFILRDGKIFVDDEPLVLYHCHQLIHDEYGGITFRTHWELPKSADIVYQEYEKALRAVKF